MRRHAAGAAVIPLVADRRARARQRGRGAHQHARRRREAARGVRDRVRRRDCRPDGKIYASQPRVYEPARSRSQRISPTARTSGNRSTFTPRRCAEPTIPWRWWSCSMAAGSSAAAEPAPRTWQTTSRVPETRASTAGIGSRPMRTGRRAHVTWGAAYPAKSHAAEDRR